MNRFSNTVLQLLGGGGLPDCDGKRNRRPWVPSAQPPPRQPQSRGRRGPSGRLPRRLLSATVRGADTGEGPRSPRPSHLPRAEDGGLSSRNGDGEHDSRPEEAGDARPSDGGRRPFGRCDVTVVSSLSVGRAGDVTSKVSRSAWNPHTALGEHQGGVPSTHFPEPRGDRINARDLGSLGLDGPARHGSLRVRRFGLKCGQTDTSSGRGQEQPRVRFLLFG